MYIINLRETCVVYQNIIQYFLYFQLYNVTNSDISFFLHSITGTISPAHTRHISHKHDTLMIVKPLKRWNLFMEIKGVLVALSASFEYWCNGFTAIINILILSVREPSSIVRIWHLKTVPALKGLLLRRWVHIKPTLGERFVLAELTISLK